MRGETRDRGGEVHQSSVGGVGESIPFTAYSATATTREDSDENLCSEEKQGDEQHVLYADDLVDCFVREDSEATTADVHVGARDTNPGVGTSMPLSVRRTDGKKSDDDCMLDDNDDDDVAADPHVVHGTSQAQAQASSSAPPMTTGALVRAIVTVISEGEAPLEIADAVRRVLIAAPQRARDVAAWAERTLARPASALTHGDEVALRIALDLVRRVAVDVAAEVKVVEAGSADE